MSTHIEMGINPEELAQYREHEPVFTPENADEFHAWAKEMEDQLEPVNEQELKGVKLHWRGMQPEQALGLVHGDLDEIELKSRHPNTSLDYGKAIAYGTRGQNAEKLRMTVALGFVPEDDWDIQPGHMNIPRDQQFKESIDYQRGNFIVNGKLHRDDVRYVMVRFAGDKPGQVGPTEIYEYHPKEEHPS